MKPWIFFILAALGPVASTQAQPRGSRASGLEDVADLMGRYATALGGYPSLRSASSALADGRFHLLERNWPMQLSWRSPNLARMRIEQSAGTYVLLHDGEGFWRKLPWENNYIPMQPDQALVFEQLIRLVHPVLELYEGGHEIEHLGTELFDKQEVEVLSYRLPEAGEFRVLFNSATNLPLASVLPSNEDGSQTVVQYSDYRGVRNLQVAHRIEVRVDGWTEQVFTYDTMTLNVGILTNLFDHDN